jgi:hypothetical protein
LFEEYFLEEAVGVLDDLVAVEPALFVAHLGQSEGVLHGDQLDVFGVEEGADLLKLLLDYLLRVLEETTQFPV